MLFKTILLDYNPLTDLIIRWALLVGVLLVLFKILIPLFIKLINLIHALKTDINLASYKYKHRPQQIVRDEKIKKQLLEESRPPILYLRSFSEDGIKIKSSEKPINFTHTFKGLKFGGDFTPVEESFIELNFETKLSNKADEVGPFVAIGAPHESGKNLEALRLYYPDKIRQEEVDKLIANAPMIFARIKGGITKGFSRELAQIKRYYLHKTIFSITVDNQKDYQSLACVLNAHDIILPPYKSFLPGVNLFVEFDENGNYSFSTSLGCMKIFNKCKSLSQQKNKK